MVKTKIIFLRHAETQKDPTVNATLWGLSEKGKSQSEEISANQIMNEVSVIFCSEEKKTSLTAEPLAKKLSKNIKQSVYFDEVKRGDKFLTKEEFEIEKIKQLEDLSYKAFDGESGLDALARFKRGINAVISENIGKTILVVTHGTVLNIYFADLLGVQAKLAERWSKTDFCALGVVEDGVVIKDIV